MNLIESYRESFNTKGMSRKLEGRGSSLYQRVQFSDPRRMGYVTSL
jgi:hypothetical protein